ncbi:MAG: response regulator transcription factor [Rhodospirillales bacterium]|nr:response regulator transcription factor [Rhodospirillales bacterium]
MYNKRTIRAEGAKGEGITTKNKGWPKAKAPVVGRQRDGGESRALPRLTPRQMDVLGLVARGYSNKRIAGTLGLAEGTVKLHVAAVLKALGVVNRTQAAFEATALGLVSAAVPGQLTIGDVGS